MMMSMLSSLIFVLFLLSLSEILVLCWRLDDIKGLCNGYLPRKCRKSSIQGFIDKFNLKDTRKQFLKVSSTLILLNSAILGFSPSDTVAQSSPSLEVTVLPPPVKAKRPLAYSVEMADPQYLQPRTPQGEESLLTRLVNSKVILFGERSLSETLAEKDIKLQISLLDRMLKINPKRKIVIASQALPQNRQIDQALRDFIASKTSSETKENQDDASEAQLFKAIEDSLSSTEKRKHLSEIQSQLPLFRWARDHSYPIVSLDLPDEIQTQLRKGGLSRLSEEVKSRYLIDPEGFLAAVTNPAYPTYVDHILKEQYIRDLANTATNPSFPSENPELPPSSPDFSESGFPHYVSSKMFQHEAIATRLLATLLSPTSPLAQEVDNKSLLPLIPSDSTTSTSTRISDDSQSLPLVVATVHNEDAVFHYGIEERLKRLKAFLFDPPRYRQKYFYDQINQLIAARDSLQGPGSIEIQSEMRVTGKVDLQEEIYSVLLNPTATDSFSRIAGLRLGLAFDDDFINDRTLSDFIWFSDSPEIKLLTRPQNPISREGDKPEGETSILGVF